MEIQNTILDDICAEIGFTATSVIAAWYGRNSSPLYVPKSPDTPSHLQRLIGQSAYAQLVRAFGGTQIRNIPTNRIYTVYLRRRQVFDMLKEGIDIQSICAATDLSSVHVTTLRREFEDVGVLPLILKEPATND